MGFFKAQPTGLFFLKNVFLTWTKPGLFKKSHLSGFGDIFLSYEDRALKYAIPTGFGGFTVLGRHGPIHVFQNIVIYDPFLRNITILTIFTIFAIRNTGRVT